MNSDDISLERRRIIGMGLGLTAALAVTPSWAAFSKLPERKLSFYGLHTGERINTVYWQNGRYIPDGLAEINHLLRDHRTNDIHRIEPELLDLLVRLRSRVGSYRPFDVISGYRSPATNEALRNKSNGVAQKSMHMLGQAIDVHLPGVRLANLHKAALSLKSGGVGYYGASNFIHVDVGRVRNW